jgi:uncharacterized protein YbjQ (UPF0145 family)
MSTFKSKSKASTKDTNPDTLSSTRCFTETSGIITTTMNFIPGYRVVRVLGTVYGLTVRARNIGADLASGLKAMVGGELSYLTGMLYAGRNQAVERMIGEVMARDGNAVIAMRFDTSEVMGFAQVCAYGTACLVERDDGAEQKEEVDLGEISS